MSEGERGGYARPSAKVCGHKGCPLPAGHIEPHIVGPYVKPVEDWAGITVKIPYGKRSAQHLPEDAQPWVAIVVDAEDVPIIEKYRWRADINGRIYRPAKSPSGRSMPQQLAHELLGQKQPGSGRRATQGELGPWNYQKANLFWMSEAPPQARRRRQLRDQRRREALAQPPPPEPEPPQEQTLEEPLEPAPAQASLMPREVSFKLEPVWVLRVDGQVIARGTREEVMNKWLEMETANDG